MRVPSTLQVMIERTGRASCLCSWQRQDDFKSAAKELTEAVAQHEEDNLVLSFATATDADHIAYLYAQAVQHVMQTTHHGYGSSPASCTCLSDTVVNSHLAVDAAADMLQWRTREGENHLEAQHTLKYLDRVKVIMCLVVMSCHAVLSVLLHTLSVSGF